MSNEVDENTISQAIYNSLSDSAEELGGWDALDDEAFTKAARCLQPFLRIKSTKGEASHE
jgi:hypothetical protein